MQRMTCWMAAILPLWLLPMMTAQNFSSGSNGSDGALNLTTPGTIVFDPKSFTPPLDQDGDGIYHFSTITIASGVTVRFSGRNLNGPIYWLASGAIQIDGILDLNGEPGHPSNAVSTNVRLPAYPGAGGFFGGVGGRSGTSFPAQAGGGPGGGAAGVLVSCCTAGGANGSFTGNQFLIPLIGGSGGGGGVSEGGGTGTYGGGGGGGGAILLASSSSITIRGVVQVRGGPPLNGGGHGASGGIRLVANAITVSGGTLDVSGIAFGASLIGVLRIETFQYSGPTLGPVVSPSGLFLPSGPNPSIRIASIAGIPTPALPTGSFTVPDIAINTTSAVPVVVEAKNIPIGTVVKLRLLSEQGADQIIDTTPLAGTTSLSTGTASALFPSGYSRGFVRATWTQ